MKSLQERLKEYFNAAPEADVVWVTADERMFGGNDGANNARQHGVRIGKKKVEVYRRDSPQAETELGKALKSGAGSAKALEKAAAEKAEAEKAAADKAAAEKAAADKAEAEKAAAEKAEAEKAAAEKAEAEKAEAAKAAEQVNEVKKPTDKMTREALADWLNEQGVEFDLKDLKKELLDKATAKYEALTKNEQ